MKRLSALELTRVMVEIRPTSLHAWADDTGIDIPLERGADGRLLPTSAAGATAALQGLLVGKSWLSRAQILCAIGSRGVLLRSLSLPAAEPSEVTRLVQLQIESEFPLPPEALAWGWIPLAGKAAGNTPNSARQEVLVAAVKKEVIEEYIALLAPLDADPTFTLAALARLGAIPDSSPPFAVLDIGPTHSELTLVEAGVAPSVQILPWGESRIVDQLAVASGQTREQAVANLAKLSVNSLTTADSNQAQSMPAALDEVMRQLVATLPGTATTLPLWIAGSPTLAPLLKARPETFNSTRSFPVPTGPGRTAATVGLQQTLALGASGLITLQIKPVAAPNTTIRSLPHRQIAVAAALLLGVLLFPYLEALLFQPRLARRLAALQAGQPQLTAIDRELSFFRYFEQNQSPHLDAAFVIAQAAPPGAHLDQVSINRQGNVSLSGYLRDLSQIGDFRIKLVNSGFFSSVVAEDQTPTPDRQRINFRMTAQWKDVNEREALALGPVLPEPGVGKVVITNLTLGTKASGGTTNAPLNVTNSNSSTNISSTSNPPAGTPLTSPLPPSAAHPAP